MFTSRKTPQTSNTRRDDKKLDERQVNPQPKRPVPLDPSQLDHVGGGTGTSAPRTTW